MDAYTIQLVTSQGRSVYLGIQPPPNWSRSRWTLLDMPSRTASRIHAEITTYGMRRLGFETPRPQRRDQLPRVEWPTSTHPTFAQGEHFVWNRASLNHVAQIFLCRRHSHGRSIITGLLIYYADGHQACVGQVKLDCLGEVLRIDPACKLWLGFWLSDDGPCVSNAVLALQQPRLTDCENWFGVEWRGYLEWWFSCRQCQLSFEGRPSPKTIRFRRRRGG